MPTGGVRSTRGRMKMGNDLFITLLICGMTGLGVYIVLEYRRFSNEQHAKTTLGSMHTELEGARSELVGLKKYLEYLAPAQQAVLDQLDAVQVSVTREGSHVETITPPAPPPATPPAGSNSSAQPAAMSTATSTTTPANAEAAAPAPPKPEAPIKLVVRFEATHQFGFANPPEKFNISASNTGITLAIDRPQALGKPSVRPLPYADMGHKVTPSTAHADVVKKLPSIAQKQAGTAALDEPVQALLEKKLITALSNFLLQQPGVRQIPHITVVYY